MNKKGLSWTVILTAILGLAILSILLWGVIPFIKSFFVDAGQMTKCQGLDGRCVRTAADCPGKASSGFGCTGDTSLCCFTDEKLPTCESGNWKDEECKVRLISATANPLQPGPLRALEPFRVTCTTNLAGVPCLSKVTVYSNSADLRLEDCVYQPQDNYGDDKIVYLCPGFPAGTYYANCMLNEDLPEEKKCFVEFGDNQIQSSPFSIVDV